jgi:hypothetical protein
MYRGGQKKDGSSEAKRQQHVFHGEPQSAAPPSFGITLAGRPSFQRRGLGLRNSDPSFQLYLGILFPLVFYDFQPTFVCRTEGIGEIAMADMDEGSRGGRRSVLAFGIVAAIMTVLLIAIGVSGKNVTSNMAQSNTETPATSGSQNP